MKVTLEIDGEPREVDVDLIERTATVGGRTFPIQVLSTGPSKVELEIDGERVVVEGWFAGVTAPEEPVAVGGELHRVRAEVAAGTRPPGAVPVRTAPTASATPAAPAAAAGRGTAVIPPMPGKVVELRVQEGDRVALGQVLLVLEAMKMRNEVASPAAGRVTDLRVRAGSNVRAREAMLVIVAE